MFSDAAVQALVQLHGKWVWEEIQLSGNFPFHEAVLCRSVPSLVLLCSRANAWIGALQEAVQGNIPPLYLAQLLIVASFPVTH